MKKWFCENLRVVLGKMEASRSDVSASLPPRKRLLAGLKQSGWFASASPASSSVPEKKSEEGKGDDLKKANAEEKRDFSDYSRCVSCGTRGGSDGKLVLERVKSGRALVSVCDSCNCSLDCGIICSYCFVRIPDSKDSSIALSCCKCQHRVHCDCISKNNPACLCSDPRSFVCVDCVSSKRPLDVINGHKENVVGLREEVGLGNCNLANDCGGKEELGLAACSTSELGPCTLSTATTDIIVSSVDKTSALSVHSTVGKKVPLNCKPHEAQSAGEPQIVDDPREKTLGSLASGSIGKADFALSGKSSLSPEQIVEEAKAAALTAVEAVAVAKATAFKKAAEAVKAAAAAKDALDLAALAAREEKEIRALLRKSNKAKHETVKHPEKRKKVEPKEVKEEAAAAPPFVDDEELARQLHRAMNSSPRISRNTGSLGARDSRKFTDSDCSRAYCQHSGMPKQQTRPRSPLPRETKKQEPKLRKKSDSVNSGKLAQRIKPGSQSACEKFGDCGIDKLLQTLDHSEAESSAGLLALNLDASAAKPSVEAEARGLIDGRMITQVPFPDYDEKASDAGRALKELGVCNYSRPFSRDGNDVPHESEVGNLEKLAETVAVVMEEENSRCEEGKLEASVKEEPHFTPKHIEPTTEQHNLCSGNAASQKQAGFKRKRAPLDSLKTEESRIRLSKCSRAPAQAGNYEDHLVMETEDSSLTAESTMRSHTSLSNMRNSSERRTKSISGDFSQESQSVPTISSWRKDIFKPSQSFAGSVSLATFRSAPPVPLQSPAFASGSSGQRS